MPLSIRLGQELERKITQLAKILKTTKTEIIRHSLEDYLSKILEINKQNPYQCYLKLYSLLPGSSEGSLSVSPRDKILKYIKREHS